MPGFRTLALAVLCLVMLDAPAAAEAGGMNLSVTLQNREGEEVRQSYFHYELTPGQSREDRILLRNMGEEPLRVALYPADGANTPDGGLTGPLLGEPNRAVGQWVDLSGRELTLEPGAEARVDVRLQVPEDASPGDHFGFIFVQTVSEPEEKPVGEGQASFAVKLRTRFGITLWERVPGAHQAGLDVAAPRKSIDEGQLVLGFDVLNTGNLFLKPEGSWRLLGPDGGKVLERGHGPWGYLLPGSRLVMRVPVTTERPLVRGDYRLQVDVRYPLEGETRAKTAEFVLALP